MKLERIPTTRSGVEEQIDEFFKAGLAEYGRQRNFVSEDLSEVSILSPATRHRIVTEYSLATRATTVAGKSRSEKFRQEIFWRLYWKGYLEQHPEIWTNWLDSQKTFSDEVLDRTDKVSHGRSGVAVMDYFAAQLIETGYLHNHARMWFAAFWIHTCRLPWELGARFFMSHLLDGDPASNTLSWRWVAGLHTKGKQYLVRRSNIEKYLDPAIVSRHQKGLEVIDDTKVEPIEVKFEKAADLTPVQTFSTAYHRCGLEKTGLWIHEDDLDFSTSPLSEVQPHFIFISHSLCAWKKLVPDRKRTEYITKILADAGARAHQFWPDSIICLGDGKEFATTLIDWITDNEIQSLVYLQPFIGPAREAIDSVAGFLSESGIDLCPLRRPEDDRILPLAQSGFFGFWKKAGNSFAGES